MFKISKEMQGSDLEVDRHSKVNAYGEYPFMLEGRKDL